MSRFDPPAKRVPWPALLPAVAALALLALPDLAQASVDPYPIDTLLSRFEGVLNRWSDAVQTAADWLFWTLATISLTWTMSMMLFRRADFGELFAELVRFVVLTGIFWWLLSSGGGADGLIHSILDSMKIMGERASSDSTGGLRPSALLRSGYEVFFEVAKQSSEQAWTDADKIVGLFLATLVVTLVALAAVSMMVIAVMAWILAYGGLFLLGFGGARWTSGVAINYYKHVLAVGIAYFTMMLLAGTGEIFLSEYSTEVVGEITLPNLMVMVVAAIVLLALLVRIPTLVSSIVLGSRFGSGSDAGTFSGRVMAMGGTAIASGIDRAGHGAQALYAAYRGEPAAAAPAPYATHAASHAGGHAGSVHASDLGATLPASVLATHTSYNNDYGSGSLGSVFAATTPPHEVARTHAPAELYRPVAAPAAERPASAPVAAATFGTAAAAASLSQGAAQAAATVLPQSAMGTAAGAASAAADVQRAGRTDGGQDDTRDRLAHAAGAGAGAGATSLADQAARLRDAATGTDPTTANPLPLAEAIAPDAPLHTSAVPAASSFERGAGDDGEVGPNRSVLPPIVEPSLRPGERGELPRDAVDASGQPMRVDWQAPDPPPDTTTLPPQLHPAGTGEAVPLPLERGAPPALSAPAGSDLPPAVIDVQAPAQAPPVLPQALAASVSGTAPAPPVLPANLQVPGVDADDARVPPQLQNVAPTDAQRPQVPPTVQLPGVDGPDTVLPPQSASLPAAPSAQLSSTLAVTDLDRQGATVAQSLQATAPAVPSGAPVQVSVVQANDRSPPPQITPPSVATPPPAERPLPTATIDNPAAATTAVPHSTGAAVPEVGVPTLSVPPHTVEGSVPPSTRTAAASTVLPNPPPQTQTPPPPPPLPPPVAAATAPSAALRAEAAPAAGAGTPPLPPPASASTSSTADGRNVQPAPTTVLQPGSAGGNPPSTPVLPAASVSLPATPAGAAVVPAAPQGSAAVPVLPAARPGPTLPAAAPVVHTAPPASAGRDPTAADATPTAATDNAVHAASSAPPHSDAAPPPQAPAPQGGEDGH